MRGQSSRATTYSLLVLLAGAGPVFAQDAARDATSSPPALTWRVAAGHGTLWIRDVASSRLGRHVDASPVSWEARGAAVTAALDRATLRRLQRLEMAVERSGDAVFRTPISKARRPGSDSGLRGAGRYEYRHYPFVDLGVRGFDLGAGLQAGTEFGAVTRHFDPSIETRARETSFTGGVVAAARLRRWRRVQLEVAWVNGGSVVRTSVRHSEAETPDVSRWGVGWLTDLTARADVRLADAVAVFVSYFDTGRGRFVSHDASASGRRLWMVGVSHVR